MKGTSKMQIFAGNFNEKNKTVTHLYDLKKILSHDDYGLLDKDAIDLSPISGIEIIKREADLEKEIPETYIVLINSLICCLIFEGKEKIKKRRGK
jgi:hypothetical protein